VERLLARRATPIHEDKESAPVLHFGRYAIAFHLATELSRDAPMRQTRGESGNVRPPASEEARALQSYETDMLLHAHRDDPPFTTRIIVSAEEPQTLTVRFPAVTTYEAEGNRKRVRCYGADDDGRRRTFDLAAASTRFETGIAVLTLVLRPRSEPHSAESELNEYDLIKLIKLWEGGELIELTDSGRKIFVPGQNDELTEIRFDSTTGNGTLEDVAQSIFPHWSPLPRKDARHRAYRVGTVELELPTRDWRKELPRRDWRRQLFRDLAALKNGGAVPKTDSAGWRRVVAVGGILQGLLDFREIEEYELADVFAEADIDPDDESLLAIHKGTLVSLGTASDSPDERPSPIGIDPYLAIPNVVLLHNEERLKAARLLEQELSRGDPIRPFAKGTLTISVTENRLGHMARLLAQHLPNVFHYSNERRLYERGQQSRGFDDLETLLRLRMDELLSVLQERVRRRDRWTTGLGIIIGVAATAQAFIVQEAIQDVPLVIVLLIALCLYAGLYLLRNTRLF
jgi:hypothetical protein